MTPRAAEAEHRRAGAAYLEARLVAINLSKELGLEHPRSEEVNELLKSGAPVLDRRMAAFCKMYLLSEALGDAEEALEAAKAFAPSVVVPGAPVVAGAAPEMAKPNAAKVAEGPGRRAKQGTVAPKVDPTAKRRPPVAAEGVQTNSRKAKPMPTPRTLGMYTAAAHVKPASGAPKRRA